MTKAYGNGCPIKPAHTVTATVDSESMPNPKARLCALLTAGGK